MRRYLFLLTIFVPALVAQKLQLGQINERVVSPSVAAQSYGLYLPSNYSDAKKWPVVFVFDPGARAVPTIELFREGAEKYGYVVFCSWNSRNGYWNQTTAAMETMWNDALSGFSVDEKQFYTAGYSGGSRAALTFALATKAIAGVIAGGAGFATPTPPAKIPFATFLVTSTEDFNWLEMHSLNRHMEKVKVAHRFTIVEGPHRWPPAATITQGLEWLRIRAMRDGRVPKDAAMILSFTQARLGEMAALSGNPLDLLRAYQFLGDDLDDPNWILKAEELRKSKSLKQAVRREQDEERSMQGLYAEFHQLLNAVDQGQEGMAAAKRWVETQTAVVKGAEDTQNRRVVRRTLSGLASSLVEEWLELERQKKYDQLARRLQLAIEFPTVRPNVYIELAVAHVKSGNKKAAFDALELAANKGILDLVTLNRNMGLEPLKSDPRWVALVTQVKK